MARIAPWSETRLFHALSSFYCGICFETLEKTNPAFLYSSIMGLFGPARPASQVWRCGVVCLCKHHFCFSEAFAVVDKGIGA
jgi:hypothetical protein